LLVKGREDWPQPLRLKLAGDGPALALQPGEHRVWLRGRVRDKRDSTLAGPVSAAFANLTGANVSPEADTITVAGRSLPNPLCSYPAYLNKALPDPHNLAIIHGDLHASNIIVDSTGQPWLIDFGDVGVGHAIADFIKLDRFLRHLLHERGQYSLESLVEFECRLLQATLAGTAAAAFSFEDETLAKTFAVMLHLRQLAVELGLMRGRLEAQFRQEYLPAFFLHSVAALKHYQKPEEYAMARHTFIAAAVTLDYLENGACSEPASASVREAIETPTQTQPKIFYKVPPLRRYFVDRPETTGNIKTELLRENAASVWVISAVHGQGGIGKTTAATLLSHDPDIQRHFADGILWVQLGKTPDLLTELNGWIKALAGPGAPSFPTIDAAANNLHLLLQDKAALLVIDDAWQVEHVQPFLGGGDRCGVLITTRQAAIAEEYGLSPVRMPGLSVAQAEELLGGYLAPGRTLTAREQAEAKRLGQMTGYLPLALELATARVAKRAGTTDLATALAEETADFKAYLDRHRGKNKLDLSLLRSIEQLKSEEGEPAWVDFLWLGVLPEDVTVAAPMTTTLWGLADHNEADDRLELLDSYALLKPAGRVEIDHRSWRAYQLHDAIHHLAHHLLQAPPQQAAEPPGLGLELAAAQAQLLDRYRAKTQNGQWHTLPDDGYIQAHLTWHMAQAGQFDRLDELLAETDTAGRNGWYQAREQQAQMAGFIEDVARALEHVEEILAQPVSDPGWGKILGRQVRYYLLLASLNSLAGNLPPELLESLVKYELWPPALALDYAGRMLDSWQRATALGKIAPYLQAKILLQRALVVAGQVEYEGHRATVLTGLAPHLPAELLGQALAAARQIEDERDRARVLTGLAPHLPAELLGQALAAARQVEAEWYRAWVLTGLAPHLPAELLGDALAAARQIGDEEYRARALTGLAPHLPEPVQVQALDEALAAARLIEDERDRAQVLTWLAPHLIQQLPLPELNDLWRQSLPVLAGRARKDFLIELRGLAPVLAHLGGAEAMAEIYRAIRDVGRWWP
jgi:hypothetical protein